MLFFVLSGYLLMNLLLQEHAKTGSIDLKLFYLLKIPQNISDIFMPTWR